MKLIDNAETVVVVISAGIGMTAGDRYSAFALKEAVDGRGAGHPYRRAVIVSDLAWLDTPMLHDTPTISVGGPGVNAVAGRFGDELPTVWSDQDRAVIQAAFEAAPQRAALWGADAAATAAAVDAFIARGWLDEFLDRCWRFRAGAFA
ncbi:MAG: hypothetical protein ACREL5_06865 [Gemmatimonadales bacterium]